MSSRIVSHGGCTHSSSYLMGNNLSQRHDSSYTSNSEYGKIPHSMGSAASTNHETTSSRSQFQRRSIPELSERRSPISGRPLPKGPGPLFPGNNMKLNKKKHECIPVQGKGPLRANHLLAQKGVQYVGDKRDLTSPNNSRSLSRLKSRSLDDVRKDDKSQLQKPSADKIVTDYDMKKARKAFRISRSPSYDNIKARSQQTERDQRAVLDKLSKMSTDGASTRFEHDKSSSKILSSLHSSHSKLNDQISLRKNSLSKIPMQHKTDVYVEPITAKHNRSIRQDGIDRGRIGFREEQLLRRSSDSAYESNSSTGSNSGNSSPKNLREQQSDSRSHQCGSDFFGKGLVGLRNLGNTCFMNSIIQCLRSSKRLRSIFCNETLAEELINAAPRNKGGLARAFTSVLREMWNHCTTGTVVTPSALKSQVQRYAPRFVGYNQQDSQEFLRFLLEGLHDDLNVCREKVKSQMPDVSSLSDTEQARIAWELYEKREKSVISDLFVGQLKSTLTCTDCKYRSLTFDPFWDLSLPIPSKSRTSLISGKVSLDECFKRFTQEEVLDGDEKPTCEKCKKRRRCLKQFSIERFPQILVIHLKRFSGMRYRTKLETMVDFPLDLNLSNYAAHSPTKKSEAQYRLYGISNHSGGTYSGHYTAHCKHPDSEDWFYYSDSRLSKLPQSRVVTEEAYVLFYELLNQMSYL